MQVDDQGATPPFLEGEELQLLVDAVWLVLLQCLNALTTLVVCVYAGEYICICDLRLLSLSCNHAFLYRWKMIGDL